MVKLKKGFTLLELIVVIIIIGILATLGITQYGPMIERARGAEARAILGFIRTQALGFYLRNNTLTGFDSTAASIGTAPDLIPGSTSADCRASHYFWYNISVNPLGDELVATATRCGAAGKGGNNPAENRKLELTTTFPGPTDVWYTDGSY